MNILSLVMVLLVSLSSSSAWSSIEKAKLLNEHGLPAAAKEELIDHIFSGAPESEVASAYYLLGTISFEENKVEAALSAWRALVKQFPTSQEAASVQDRMAELAEVVGESSSEILNNVIAQSYMSHAEFWSRGKSQTFRIDSSWIANVEASVQWYDKIIAEFPGTPAANRAYVGKMKTLIGWKEPGQYGSSHGLEDNFSVYISQLIETFSAYEAAFPDSGSLQALRYQIAQGYWSEKNWPETRIWLNKIIESGGAENSFYKDLAERRLLNVEY